MCAYAFFEKLRTMKIVIVSFHKFSVKYYKSFYHITNSSICNNICFMLSINHLFFRFMLSINHLFFLVSHITFFSKVPSVTYLWLQI